MSYEELNEELQNGKRILVNVMSDKVKTLAFPYGSYNKQVLDEAKNIGFTIAFSIMPDIRGYKRDAFLRGRIAASPDDWNIEFYLKIKGCYRWLTIATKIKKAFRMKLNGNVLHKD